MMGISGDSVARSLCSQNCEIISLWGQESVSREFGLSVQFQDMYMHMCVLCYSEWTWPVLLNGMQSKK